MNNIAQQYSTIINAILTILLVGVTAWLAVVTKRMWREMAESRLASIRPLLSVGIGPLERKVPPPGNDSLFMGQVNLFNFGRGPAYALRVTMEIPSEHRKDNSRAETGLQHSPQATFMPSESKQFIYKIFNHGAMPDQPAKHYLDLLCQFRDGEGNYYSVLQQYSLVPISAPPVSKVELFSEEIRFSQFSKYRYRETHSYPCHQKMDLVVAQGRPGPLLEGAFNERSGR